MPFIYASQIFRFKRIKLEKHAVITNSYDTILNDYTWIKLKQSDNICVLLTWQLKICKFKNTYTQDNKQLFQIIGQIHGAMLLNIDLFTLSCCY